MLGFIPYNISLYKLAMLHKSAHIRQAGGRILNNERLEYLGDSVIETVVSDILYNKYPDKSEGELTNIRARIVQRDTLDKLAIAIGLDKLVFTNKKCTQNFMSRISGAPSHCPRPRPSKRYHEPHRYFS